MCSSILPFSSISRNQSLEKHNLNELRYKPSPQRDSDSKFIDSITHMVKPIISVSIFLKFGSSSSSVLFFFSNMYLLILTLSPGSS